MKWDTRDDGNPVLAVLTGYELNISAEDAVAVRLEFAEVQEQLEGETPPSVKQLVMNADAAEALGKWLIDAAELAR